MRAVAGAKHLCLEEGAQSAWAPTLACSVPGVWLPRVLLGSALIILLPALVFAGLAPLVLVMPAPVCLALALVILLSALVVGDLAPFLILLAPVCLALALLILLSALVVGGLAPLFIVLLLELFILQFALGWLGLALLIVLAPLVGARNGGNESDSQTNRQYPSRDGAVHESSSWSARMVERHLGCRRRGGASTTRICRRRVLTLARGVRVDGEGERRDEHEQGEREPGDQGDLRYGEGAAPVWLHAPAAQAAPEEGSV